MMNSYKRLVEYSNMMYVCAVHMGIGMATITCSVGKHTISSPLDTTSST